MYYLQEEGPKSTRKQKMRKDFWQFAPKSTFDRIKVSRGFSLIESKSFPPSAQHSVTSRFLQRSCIAQGAYSVYRIESHMTNPPDAPEKQKLNDWGGLAVRKTPLPLPRYCEDGLMNREL